MPGGGATTHRQLLRDYLDAYNRGELAEIDRYVTAGYVHHNNDASLSLDGFKAGATWLRRAMPDFRIEMADSVEEGDRLAVRWLGRGTHARSMFGEPVTERQLVLYGTTIFRFEDGRIAEDWEAMDEAELRRQAGALAD